MSRIQPKYVPCLEYGCNDWATYQGRCDEHKKQWTGVSRKNDLPRDWADRRKAVIARDDSSCYVCGRYGNEVDHILHGNNHSYNNLAVICSEHHKEKSSWEGHLAQGHNVEEPEWLNDALVSLGIYRVF